MTSTLTKTRVAGALICAAIAFPTLAPGASSGQDLRSPDARDGLSAASSQDLRSPDTRDAVAPVLEPQLVVGRPSSPGGFDWTSAGIGAAAGTGLLIVLLAVFGTSGRQLTGRRHGTVGT